MPKRPSFWIIAGINGAGKSTIVRNRGLSSLIRGIRYLNPDEFVPGIRAAHPELDLTTANRYAAERTEGIVDEYISRRQSLVVETVLSTSKYFDRINAAKKAGFRVMMIYVTVKHVETAIDRVRLRVVMGGHDVPEERIRARWMRSHQQLRYFCAIVDKLWIFSNEMDTGPELVFESDPKTGEIMLLQPGLLPSIEDALQGLFAVGK